MKKALCVILILSLLLLPACNTPEKKIQDPVFFYYRQLELDYGANPGVLNKEVREAAGHRQDYSYLLTEYFKGPADFSSYNPFPSNTSLKEFSLQGDTAFVDLNYSFSSLTGLDLSIACACITLTVCEMTGSRQVTISAQHGLLDGTPSITMTPDSLLMLDDSNIVIPPE